MESAGFGFEVIPAEGEELIPENTPPEEVVVHLALQKAEEVAARFTEHPDYTVVGADTIVVCDGEILGKPLDEGDAFAMLKKLSGRKHDVFTGVAIFCGVSGLPRTETNTFFEKTVVEFHPLTDEEINAYIQTGEPFDKAGAYGIQGKGMLLVKEINGDFYNVMGLPISRVSRILRDSGYGTDESVPCKINDLLDIMARLRRDCPWDREQNHTSIRSNLIEEAYEVAEAIDLRDPEQLCEELGDLLLQVVFHAQIAKESATAAFDFNDICDGICKKLIYRHPHIFSTVTAENTDEVLKNWEDLKNNSKGEQTAYDTLMSVPKNFPALMRGEKVGKRAARTGFDFADTKETLDCLKSEIEELEAALEGDLVNLHKKECQIEEEFGDILFSCCNLGRFLKKDCEKALTFSINRFIIRFGRLEKTALESGKIIAELNRHQLDELWQASKKMP
jgi:tetrapyrrole methylase family protein/MazG family protein